MNKTPIVCSDIPENKEIFSDKELLFFETGNAEDLAKKIDLALSNDTMLKEKTNRAFQTLKLKYDQKKIARHYNDLYTRL